MQSDSGSWYVDHGMWYYFDKWMAELTQDQLPQDYEEQVHYPRLFGRFRYCHALLDRYNDSDTIQESLIFPVEPCLQFLIHNPPGSITLLYATCARIPYSLESRGNPTSLHASTVSRQASTGSYAQSLCPKPLPLPSCPPRYTKTPFPAASMCFTARAS
ncbi:hypothetical protein V6N13_123362 [Hibiscus sabdariffa]|uniref:Uncharacterized protein n=1 Tax=Hibiscus sabdariffa TaxID=183260 RepID=A0ABR2A965_9ROSI